MARRGEPPPKKRLLTNEQSEINKSKAIERLCGALYNNISASWYLSRGELDQIGRDSGFINCFRSLYNLAPVPESDGSTERTVEASKHFEDYLKDIFTRIVADAKLVMGDKYNSFCGPFGGKFFDDEGDATPDLNQLLVFVEGRQAEKNILLEKSFGITVDGTSGVWGKLDKKKYSEYKEGDEYSRTEGVYSNPKRPDEGDDPFDIYYDVVHLDRFPVTKAKRRVECRFFRFKQHPGILWERNGKREYRQREEKDILSEALRVMEILKLALPDRATAETALGQMPRPNEIRVAIIDFNPEISRWQIIVRKPNGRFVITENPFINSDRLRTRLDDGTGPVFLGVVSDPATTSEPL